MDIREGDVITMTPAGRVRLGRRLNGAVAELTIHADGTITAEIRIPGPAAP